jgi:site-specific DNA recombinase
MKKRKAAGYVRVSSGKQVEGESLSVQRKSIEQYCKANNIELIEIYADEGISGGTVKDRPGLLQCLEHGTMGKFDTLIVWSLSRFGRNARELLNNHDELKRYEISLISIKENIDFGNRYGEAMLGMFSIMAQLENDMRRETMYDSKVARAKRGIPTNGSMPYARHYDRQQNKWIVDEKKASFIEMAADQFLNNDLPLTEVHKNLSKLGFDIEYTYLRKVLTEKSGDTWQVKFKSDQEPVEYKIPRLLSETTIQKLKERLHTGLGTSKENRAKYLLSKFLICEKCGVFFNGQMQHKKYKYYFHRKIKGCGFAAVKADILEKAVFETIFENIYDVPTFNKAIEQSLPDESHILQLKKTITSLEKDLTKTEKELDKLVDLAINGTLKQETIQAKENDLLERKEQLESTLNAKQIEYRNLPDVDEVKKDAEDIRRMLKLELQSPEHVQNMTFEQKRKLLHFLFDGTDEHGQKYGIYLDFKGSGKGRTIDYFMYGRLTGLRTIKGNDINYPPDTGNLPDLPAGTIKGGKKNHKPSDFEKGKRNYKTNSCRFNGNNKFYKIEFRVKAHTGT